jgi:putative ABC transport system permease protein
MRPAWRLATNSLSARRSRTALLVASVALSSGLIAAVACAMASVQAGVRARVEETVGAADVRIQDVGRRSFPLAVLGRVDAWPEVAFAVGRAKEPVAFRPVGGGDAVPTPTWGIMPEREYRFRPARLQAGREVRSDGEVVLDANLADGLRASVGDTVEVARFGEPVRLRVVGILRPPAFSSWLRPEAQVTLSQLGAIVESRNRLHEIDILVKPGVDPEAMVKARRGRVGEGDGGAPSSLLLHAAGKITSGLNENVESSRIGMIIGSVLAFLSASFIIMTGLTTNVTERQRELAVLRCIGGTRAQLAEAQLWVGLILGVLGAAAGVPLGVAGAAVLVSAFPEQLPSGFAISWFGAALALAGAALAGIVGAAWPAWRASRSSPLEALASRARRPRPIGIAACGVAGLALLAVHVLVLTVPKDSQVVFWADVAAGMPAMFTGYFLLSVPVCVLVTLAGAPAIGRMLGLPGGLLGRTVLATPYRHGFTAGAMMLGLALLIAIWTNGRAVMRDWLEGFAFPDAFVSGINLSEETQRRIEGIDGVTATCAISTLVVRSDATFGVRALSPPSTTFVAFEPERFFRMARLQWIQPASPAEQARAMRRLEEGGAVLVAREFLISKGLGVGDTITLSHEGRPHAFEIAGVVSSPGLDIVSQYFDIGDQYLDNAVNAVCGSRRDMIERFGNSAINLIQISIDPRANDAEVMKQVRRLVGVGVLSAGSGREIKAEISRVLRGSMLIMSILAVGAMLVSCFGVANLIVASVQARQFEFGVLRAIGAQRGQVARLVLGEAAIIAATACLLGTVQGAQAAWGGQQMNRLLLGLDLTLRLPAGAIGAGWLTLTVITIGAATPAAWRLMQRRPRELLGAVKG